MNPKSNLTPEQELKNKLRQIRADSTRAKNLLIEFERFQESFIKLRDELNDKDDGIESSSDWIKTKKAEVGALVTGIKDKITELDALITTAKDTATSIESQYTKFDELAERAFDPSTGLEALLAAAKDWHEGIKAYHAEVTLTASKADAVLVSIKETTTTVQTAYSAFATLMITVNDPKTGIQALFNQVAKYAEDALKAKTDAESELASVIALKKEGEENLESIKESRVVIQDFQKESEGLTNDIRNNLGLSSSESLSESFRLRTKSLDDSLKRWSWVQSISIVLLAISVAFIFYALFFYNTSSADVVIKLKEGPTLLSVISKILFTSPFIFAVYFSTTNYNHVRNLRDKYAFKETIAKSLQAYIKLLRAEFEDKDGNGVDKYKEARLNFSLNNMDTIYKEPVSSPKRRKYNFGINKIFNIGVEDEDIRQLEKRITESVETFIDDQVEAQTSKNTSSSKSK